MGAPAPVAADVMASSPTARDNRVVPDTFLISWPVEDPHGYSRTH